MEIKYKSFRIISPNRQISEKVKNALSYISRNNKTAFSRVSKIKAIVVLKGKYDNLLFWDLGVYVCETGTVKESSVSYLASLFVHEGQHTYQHEKKIKFKSTEQREKDAYIFQRKFLEKLNKKSEVEWLNLQLKERWWVFKTPSGKKTTVSPKNEKFRKIALRYSHDQK